MGSDMKQFRRFWIRDSGMSSCLLLCTVRNFLQLLLMPSPRNRHCTELPGSFCRNRLQLRPASGSSRDTTLCIPYEGALRDIYSHQDRNLPVLSQGIECCLNITDLGKIPQNIICNFEPLGTFLFIPGRIF